VKTVAINIVVFIHYVITAGAAGFINSAQCQRTMKSDLTLLTAFASTTLMSSTAYVSFCAV